VTVRLTSAGASLIMGPPDVTPSNAVPLALLWSEAVCRAQKLTMGTEAYFNRVVREMGAIAWNVTDAGEMTYTQASGNATPADAVVELGGQYLPTDQQRSLKTVFDAIGTAAQIPALDSLMTTFWSDKTLTAKGTCCATAPVSMNANGQLTTTLAYLDFDGSSDRWQSFFLTRMSAETRLHSRHVQLTLNADLWQRIDKPIADKLGKAAVDAIQHIDI
jgi:hypothetical protein